MGSDIGSAVRVYHPGIWMVVASSGTAGAAWRDPVSRTDEIVRNCRISVKPSLKDAVDEWVQG